MSLKLLMVLGLMYNLNTYEGPVYYDNIETYLGNQPLQIYSLVVDMDDEGVQVKNALSKEVIYGLESTSDMALNSKADAAVNGTFFDDYGHHIGGMMIEGQWITLPDPNLPTVIITEDGKVSIDIIDVNMYARTFNNIFDIDGMNRYVYGNELLLFTPIYGTTTRIYESAVNYVIKDNLIIDVVSTEDEPFIIPKDGIVLVDVNKAHNLNLQKGDTLYIEYSGLEQINAYEIFQSSSFIVKDGANVAPDYDPIIGLTTNREPRTLLGITKDNRLIINVIDGRAPGYSIGLTGSEAAQFMISFGCTDAVFLDGGASSTMVIDGKIVNKPSNGKERIVGHSIIIIDE